MVVTRPNREPIPTNEYGIVVPPEAHDCFRDGCRDRSDKEVCPETQHHLHSSKPFYEKLGGIAIDFRELEVLSVWLHRCVHTEHHYTHEIDVAAPSLDVMEQSISDDKTLKKLMMTKREIIGNDALLENGNLGKKAQAGLHRRREQLLVSHTELLGQVLTIEVIPEELITGSLLIAAPNHARSRMIMGSGVVLPGLIRKTELNEAHSLIDKFESDRISLQAGVESLREAA